MKQRDLVLLASLRQNARETLTRMSKKTKIPVSTIFDRLRYYEENLIKKHTAIIDFARLGFSTRVTITFKVHKDDRGNLRDYLMKNHNVNSVYKINNGYDFLVEGIFQSIKELEEFMEYIEETFSIKGKQVYYIIEDLKREEFLSDPEFVGMVLNPVTEPFPASFV